jgi:galactokinase
LSCFSLLSQSPGGVGGDRDSFSPLQKICREQPLGGLKSGKRHVTQEIKAAFAKLFGGDSRVFRAPGRVNLIGEHTDYNGGFVLPAAIGFDVTVACAKNDRGEWQVHSLQERDTATLNLAGPNPQPQRDWTDYIRGVALQLQNDGYVIPSAYLLVDGRVPMSAGLSSSAAFEVAVAQGLLYLSGRSMDRVSIARLCQRAENEFVGARCGIMDQFSSVFGRAGHALLIDCRTLGIRYIPLPENVSLVICNTMVKHSISGGEYNNRRRECERCVRYFAELLTEVRALRDVTEEDLREHGCRLPEVLLRRSRHVITENARVLRAADALQRQDLETLGKLMHESHISLRDDYEVSCRELDAMVDLALNIPGTYGARMTGGGFGGCTINLVDTRAVHSFKSCIFSKYKEVTNIDSEIYVTWAADGAGIAQ